ncbi:MAG TPA: Ran-binding zinc finger domain-containing protein [Actinomycetota bacterium]|nr:Ran-binding zinc finger domain-containing protein [Actinomycetota bacterium]
MDTDLFQILTLILLLGLLLTLFGVLQSLGAIRRSLEQGAPAPAASPAPETATETPEPSTEQPSAWTSAEAAAPSEAVEPGGTRTGWPAPQEAAGTPEPSTATAEPAAAAPAMGTGGERVLYGDAGLTTATPSEASLRPAETVESAHDGGSSLGGAPSQGVEAEAAAEPETTATEAQPTEDPQEQPFERDGRWWFRRGDELLVYEEQTGQWVAAPEPSSAGSVSAPTPSADATASAPAEGQVTTQQETVGSFWKCPSCGAVNGSTATSCRMCFTARP